MCWMRPLPSTCILHLRTFQVATATPLLVDGNFCSIFFLHRIRSLFFAFPDKWGWLFRSRRRLANKSVHFCLRRSLLRVFRLSSRLFFSMRSHHVLMFSHLGPGFGWIPVRRHLIQTMVCLTPANTRPCRRHIWPSNCLRRCAGRLFPGHSLPKKGPWHRDLRL